jgi:hypothetical protein
MRSSLVVRASDCQCRSRNSHGFDPNILRYSGIWVAANEAVLNTERREKIKNIPLFKIKYHHYQYAVVRYRYQCLLYGWTVRGSDRLSGRTSLLSARAPWIKATLWNRDQGVGCRLCSTYIPAHTFTQRLRAPLVLCRAIVCAQHNAATHSLM